MATIGLILDRTVVLL